MGNKISREEFNAVRQEGEEIKDRLRELEEKLNPPRQPVAQHWNPGEQQPQQQDEQQQRQVGLVGFVAETKARFEIMYQQMQTDQKQLQQMQMQLQQQQHQCEELHSEIIRLNTIINNQVQVQAGEVQNENELLELQNNT